VTRPIDHLSLNHRISAKLDQTRIYWASKRRHFLLDEGVIVVHGEASRASLCAVTLQSDSVILHASRLGSCCTACNYVLRHHHRLWYCQPTYLPDSRRVLRNKLHSSFSAETAYVAATANNFIFSLLPVNLNCYPLQAFCAPLYKFGINVCIGCL
jgi:hypothetical protein